MSVGDVYMTSDHDETISVLTRIAVALERMADAAEAESQAARLLTEAMRPTMTRPARPGESPGTRAQREAEMQTR